MKKRGNIGSGTVVTPNGLILTNFHVANMALIGESAAVKDENGQLFFNKTTPLNNGVMLVTNSTRGTTARSRFSNTRQDSLPATQI